MEEAERQFDHLSQGQKKAIFNKIKELRKNSKPAGAISLEGYPHLWRISAGNVRAIFEQPNSSGEIFVLRIARRRVAYDDLDDLLS
jgi:mRNA-degrading endonuclease RelE of RelBE toxin-antitoxin system